MRGHYYGDSFWSLLHKCFTKLWWNIVYSLISFIKFPSNQVSWIQYTSIIFEDFISMIASKLILCYSPLRLWTFYLTNTILLSIGLIVLSSKEDDFKSLSNITFSSSLFENWIFQTWFVIWFSLYMKNIKTIMTQNGIIWDFIL